MAKTLTKEESGMAEEARPRNNDPIQTRLARVAAKAVYLQKKGNNEQQGYSYAQEADYLELAKPLLAEEGIWLSVSVDSCDFRPMPPTAKGTAREMCVVKVVGTFQCNAAYEATDGNEELLHLDLVRVNSYGTGVDSGDKAVYKAITGAVKYLIAKNLQIPTGDDPESDPETDRPRERQEAPGATQDAAKGNGRADTSESLPAISEDDFKAILAAEKSRLGDDAYKAAMRGFGYGKFAEIPAGEYRKIKKALAALEGS